MQKFFNDLQLFSKDIKKASKLVKQQLYKEYQKIQVISSWPEFVATFTRDSASFYFHNPKIFASEIISGICVSTLMVPEVVAFSYAAHLEPETGLYATVFMAIFATMFTRLGGMANGAAGALAVVTKNLMDNLGPLGDLSVEDRKQYVWLTIIFVGVIQILVGYFKLAKFIKLIPETAMIGFLNGLSILIFITQLSIFQKCDGDFAVCSLNNTLYYMNIHSLELWLTVLCVAQTIIIMVGFPKIPKIGKVIPSTLVALVFTTTWEHLINRLLIHQGVRTVGDTSDFKGHFPIPGIPNISGIRWSIVLTYAFMLALIGLCESIMTLATVGDKFGIKTNASMAVQESFAQGIANFICGIFKTQGGGAMIAQAMANVYNGGKHRLSGITVGISILILVSLLPMLIKLVPVACLSGVLWVIVFKTFYWRSLFLLFKIPIEDSIAILLVTILAVVYNLATGVIAGVIWAALCNSWNSGKLLNFNIEEGENGESKIYRVKGPLYFGSAHQYIELFDEFNDPSEILVDLRECIVIDYTGVHALDLIFQKYSKKNKTLQYDNINELSSPIIQDARPSFMTKNISNISDLELNEIPILSEKVEDL
eukprot:NODE_98_length_20568_cov_1.409546.p4 type:complete len:596 gc:universal NODE_98_length_20568_cov_1.409546:15104-13317(-)